MHIETAMNNSINATTRKSPLELLYGTYVRLVSHPADTCSTISAVTDFLEKIDESIQLAKDHHIITKIHQATQANHWHCAEPNYKVEDLIYLNMGNLCLRIKQQGRSAKFFPRFVRLFPILEARPETLSYKLDLPTMYQIHPVFYAKLFKPVTPNDPERLPMREPIRPSLVFENNDGGGDNYEV